MDLTHISQYVGSGAWAIVAGFLINDMVMNRRSQQKRSDEREKYLLQIIQNNTTAYIELKQIISDAVPTARERVEALRARPTERR